MLNTGFWQKIQNEIYSIPNKCNFKIGEVAELLQVKPHVLRYWEDEFVLLKPKKFINNQRLYVKKDLEILFIIKFLLYEQNISIKGVKKNLPRYYQEMIQAKQPQIKNKKTQKLLADKIKHLLTEMQETKNEVNQILN